MATISQIHCSRCGRTYDEDGAAQFCPDCGAPRSGATVTSVWPPAGASPVPTPAPDTAAIAGPPNAETARSRDRGVLIGLGVAACLVLVAIGAGLYVGGVFNSTGPQTGTPPTQAAPRISSPSGGAVTPTTQAPSTATASTPARIASPSNTGPGAVIQSHLEDINSGSYQAAFQLLASSYRSQNPAWPSDRAAADPGIKLLSVGTPQYGSGQATVPVDFYARDRNATAGSDTQCREFQGTVTMVRESGAWRYDPSSSNLNGTVMPSSDSNCPS
jgi:hypothetical protein